MFNSVEIYARSFKPVDGGYLYYPTRWSSGYLVNEEEFQQLCADWRSVSGWKGIFKLVAIVLVVATLATLAASAWEISERAFDYITLLIAVGMLAYIVWKFTAAYRLVRTRQPAAPRRTGREVETDFSRQLTWPMALFVAVLSVWFCFLSLLVALANPVIGVPLLLLFVAATYMNGRVVYRKWLDSRS